MIEETVQMRLGAATAVSSDASDHKALDNNDFVTKTISTLVHNTVNDLQGAEKETTQEHGTMQIFL